MTAFALRIAGMRNGVSQLHGQVSRQMWQSLWPDAAEDYVAITSVTNGVHIPTWALTRDGPALRQASRT